MSKESKFYFALTLIGVCVACAVYFYFNIEQSEMVDAYKQHGSRRGRPRGEFCTTPKAIQYYNDKDSIIYMCLSLVPIIPLFFFAKNNRPDK